MENKQTIVQKKLSNPLQLPSLAKNIHVLMQSLADNELNYQQLAKVLIHYPEITARLIFLANSSWSAPVSPVISIEQACSRLGTSVVKSISIAISIASTFDTRRCPFFNTVHFWTSSLLVSKGASLLVSKLPAPLASPVLEQSAKTAGILHNLGVLWLADNLPIETDKALQIMVEESSSLSFSHSLRNSIETDYWEIVGKLAKQLNFPYVLRIAMEHHLNPDYQALFWEMALIIGEAKKMTSALHKQIDEISPNTHLEKIGIDSAIQIQVFQQLSNNFEKTHELAKTLFEG